MDKRTRVRVQGLKLAAFFTVGTLTAYYLGWHGVVGGLVVAACVAADQRLPW